MVARYFWNVLIAIDQFINTLFGGDPDETISSRAGKRQHEQKWACWLCKILNAMQTNHCAISVETDEGSRATIS